MIIEKGIVKIKELIVDKLVASIARVKKFEMVDAVTGEFIALGLNEENGRK